MFDEEQDAVEAEFAHQERIAEEQGQGHAFEVERYGQVTVLRPVPDDEDDEGEIDPLDIPDHYDLPMHGSINHCPKCGNDKVRSAFHPHGVLSEPCGKRFGWPNVQNLGEHLCRTCTRCQYGWPEQVLSGA